MDRGEIYNAALDAPGTLPGHEQTGFRPVLIISPRAYNNKSYFVMAVPITTTLSTLTLPYTIRVEPSPTNGLDATSVLLVLQFRALSNKRFGRRGLIGVIEPEILSRVMTMIQEMV